MENDKLNRDRDDASLSRRSFMQSTLTSVGAAAVLLSQASCGVNEASAQTANGLEAPTTNQIDPKKAAVLVMHYQSDILGLFPTVAPTLLANTRALLNTARQKGIKPYFIRIAFSDGYTEVNPINRNGSGLKTTGLFLNGQIPPELGQQPKEPLITARRVSVFYATELELLLRTSGIDTLIMAGIASTGVVLSSIAYASDADFRIFAVKDCCYDPDPVVHEKLFETAFNTRAVPVTLSEMQKIVSA